MIVTEPIDIDLLTFIKTGKFDYIKIGQTKEWIINNFPDPDDTYADNYNSPIWFYGDIEFHFNDEEKLSLIYSDRIYTLSGGQSLRLYKWIFDKPKELTIQNVTKSLAKERIGYKLKYETLSNGFTSAAIEILESKVKMRFSLLESEEDYSEYLDRLANTDSNLFQLHSVSLITK
ncbi:hypothetical protein [Sediminibacterium ginsengisoli]|uniref:Uncharacterized protein n=1 Tax=Sediminibacterium ginsengisoli TaxID=413434 RepID=A0A1T4JPB5_9BACT|nr:hypothetical protein [Sediminibacterium ginsengisoli]SJZ32030.1 hypothetical protein SAMN04488132_10127 [Sediminibacterium ginsengisoli]